MAGTFTVGALALAAEGANAVGAVRLTLLADVMEIELVRAAGFRRGFVPGSVAESVDMRVPYTAVRGLVRRGRALCLALDPSIGAPYTRFTLARFTYDPLYALEHAYEARRRAAFAAVVLPVPLGLVAALATPASLVSGLVGRAAVGVLVALVGWLLLREALRFATWGGPTSSRLASMLEAALAQRLGLAPIATAPFSPPPAPMEATGLPPWARAPLLVVFVSVAAVFGISFFQRNLRPASPEELPPPMPMLRAGLFAALVPPSPESLLAEPKAPLVPQLPRCVCARADSPLWKDGLPALSVLLASRPEDGSGKVVPAARRRGAPAYDFDLSVVNNSASDKRDVRVLVTFARRNDKGRRVGATDRGLFWGQPLKPGRAVKWHLTAPGTEMRVEPSITALLDSAEAPAHPDTFFALSSARQRVVRIHAAKMLAYQQDPRALSVLDSIGPASAGEELVLAQITRAARPVVACHATKSTQGVEVCLFNSSLEQRRVASLRVVGKNEGENEALSEPIVVGVDVPVHDGVRIDVPYSSETAPFELVAELEKALPQSP